MSFIDFANDGFKYNLQVFPDTLTAATFLFSILFQSPPLAALTGAIAFLNIVHPISGRFMSDIWGGAAGTNTDVSVCSGRFPGLSFANIMTGGREALNYTTFPSYYTTFLGFLTAYLGVLPVIYRKELAASPKKSATTTTALVVLAVTVAAGLIYRYLSGCDTLFGIFIGLIVGVIFGLGMVMFLAWISDRRITNILGFPLMRNKATDGKPIYVCERDPKRT